MSYEAYQCRHGIFTHLSQDNCIGLSLQLYGEWAEYEIFLLEKYLSPGMTVLDVGAHAGTHSIAFGRMVGPEGVVIAIEAQPTMHAILSTNIVRNQMTQIFPLNCVMGRTTGTYDYTQASFSNVQNFGAVTFGTQVAQSQAPLFKTILPQITIDSLGLERCDLIKIDVEGMELDVMQGAGETLRNHAPTIFFEQNSEKRFKEIFEHLTSFGYKLYWAVSYPYNQNNFKKNHKNIFGTSAEVNVLAIHESKGMIPERLPEVVVPDYEPPLPGDVIAGYPVPDVLPPVVTKDETVSKVDASKVEQIERRLIQRDAEFKALLADRTIAQQIMESQVRTIEQLQDALKSLYEPR